MFENREDAGKKLAGALSKYRGKNVLVLAIPRGGVEVGFQVAKSLDSDFSIIVSRKLPFPDNPESGFGAIAEDGSTYIIESFRNFLPKKEIEEIIEAQKKETVRRIKVLRDGLPLPEIKNRTVILIDDGIAMGSTMRVSVMLCRKTGAEKVVVATPVSGQERAREFAEIADEIVVLETPHFFRAVAESYQNWYDVSDDEVIEIMKGWKRYHLGF